MGIFSSKSEHSYTHILEEPKGKERLLESKESRQIQKGKEIELWTDDTSEENFYSEKVVPSVDVPIQLLIDPYVDVRSLTSDEQTRAKLIADIIKKTELDILEIMIRDFMIRCASPNVNKDECVLHIVDKIATWNYLDSMESHRPREKAECIWNEMGFTAVGTKLKGWPRRVISELKNNYHPDIIWGILLFFTKKFPRSEDSVFPLNRWHPFLKGEDTWRKCVILLNDHRTDSEEAFGSLGVISRSIVVKSPHIYLRQMLTY